MNYEEWIKRERRIRIKILKDSPRISNEKVYRICKCYGEVCLCHEQDYPNCSNIVEHKIIDIDKEIETRMRCQFRLHYNFIQNRWTSLPYFITKY